MNPTLLISDQDRLDRALERLRNRQDPPRADQPEYKRIQRECRIESRRAFAVKREFNQPGQIITDTRGRKYRVADDGSWRRLK